MAKGNWFQDLNNERSLTGLLKPKGERNARISTIQIIEQDGVESVVMRPYMCGVKTYRPQDLFIEVSEVMSGESTFMIRNPGGANEVQLESPAVWGLRHREDDLEHAYGLDYMIWLTRHETPDLRISAIPGYIKYEYFRTQAVVFGWVERVSHDFFRLDKAKEYEIGSYIVRARVMEKGTASYAWPEGRNYFKFLGFQFPS